MNVERGVSVDDSAGVSPPAPALPPRRYRGEVDLSVLDHLPPPGVAVPSRCVDTTNGESTLPHDTYANQLRRQARRYQHSRGSSFSHQRPPPPDWKPPPPPVLPKELSPQPSSGRGLDLEPQKSPAEDTWNSGHVSGPEVPRSRAPLNSSSGRYTIESELEKSSVLTSPRAAVTSDLSVSKTAEVRQTSAAVSLSPRGNFFDSKPSSDRQLGSSLPMTYPHPAVDVVSGYDRYYSAGDHTTSLSRSFSSFIPSDSQSSTEVSGVRSSSRSALQLNVQPTKTSPRNAVTSNAMERSTSCMTFSTESDRTVTVDQKAASVSDAALPVERGQPGMEAEVQTEASEGTKSSGNFEEDQPEVTEPSLTELRFFRRAKFPAEVDCAQQAEVVAGLLKRTDRDEALVNMLLSSAGHRTATDFTAKVLGMSESEDRHYDDFPETLQLRLSARDSRHAAL